ncbi:MAG: hypothetical protein C4291_15695 [Candidatus Dadabacteria bacterium]
MILLYSLSDDHKMKSVKLPDIDPIAVYDKSDPKKHFLRQAERAADYSENAFGEWVTDDIVKVVRGDAVIDPEDDARTKHFLVVLEIKVVGDHGQIVKQSPTGVLSNRRAESFLKRWKH